MHIFLNNCIGGLPDLLVQGAQGTLKKTKKSGANKKHWLTPWTCKTDKKQEEDAKQLLRDENKSSDWNTHLQLFKQEINLLSPNGPWNGG